MCKYIYLIIIFSLHLSKDVVSQNYLNSALNDSITLFEKKGSLGKALFVLDSFKNQLDFKRYSIMNDSLARLDLSQKLTDEEEWFLNSLRTIPYWKFKDANKQLVARDIYLETNKKVMKYYFLQGNVSYLKDMYIVPAYHSHLYPTLKVYITTLGGVWEKGEIPKPILHPPVKSNLKSD